MIYEDPVEVERGSSNVSYKEHVEVLTDTSHYESLDKRVASGRVGAYDTYTDLRTS